VIDPSRPPVIEFEEVIEESPVVEVEVERDDEVEVEVDPVSGRSTMTVEREEKGLSFPS